ncbi:hypothetical protein ACIRJR_08115 [Streptomyces sp. NPDC102402]|uniref:hypothetical protein n=1 Tax=Streptomyces sp. NPDC102402 TaxID=3366169 RepID=UPI0037F82242
MQPVVEIASPEAFGLWPVAEVERFSFQPLSGALSPPEVGTAMMGIAAYNDVEPGPDDPPRPADPLGSFLHGLLTLDPLVVSGGLRVTDTSTGVTFLPGCCDGLEDWRDWQRFVDGGRPLWFGHDPVSPVAERFGDTVRLTVDAHLSDSPLIELPVTELRALLVSAERDLADFLASATDWASVHLPDHARHIVPALARVLDLRSPTCAP